MADIEDIKEFFGKKVFLKLRYRDKPQKVTITRIAIDTFTYIDSFNCKAIESYKNIESIRIWYDEKK